MHAMPRPCSAGGSRHQGDLAAIGNLFEQLDRDGQAADIVVVNAATNPVYGPLLELELSGRDEVMNHGPCAHFFAFGPRSKA